MSIVVVSSHHQGNAFQCVGYLREDWGWAFVRTGGCQFDSVDQATAARDALIRRHPGTYTNRNTWVSTTTNAIIDDDGAHNPQCRCEAKCEG